MRHAGDQVLDGVVAEGSPDHGGALDRALQRLGIARFGQALVSGADAFEDEVLIGVSRENETDGLRMALHDLVEKLRAIHARHAHVGHDHIDGRLIHDFEGFGAALHEDHVPLVAERAQHALQALQDQRFVVNKQYSFHSCDPWRRTG